jgi:hypothetical protein
VTREIKNGRLKIGSHLQPTPQIRKALSDVLFQVKSPEIAEELTATTPLQVGRQSMNEVKDPAWPALANEGDCKVSYRTGSSLRAGGQPARNFTIVDLA